MGAISLPKMYWMAFDQPINTPFISYSCEIEDFTIFNVKSKTYNDAKGNSYTKEEYERLLPLRYHNQLAMDERMPDSIKGVEFDMHTFARARSFERIRPQDFDMPKPKLYPLIESESGRTNLELPEDVFRIDWRVDFINCNTNKVDEDKSRLFSAALFHYGFTFPAKIIAGIPTTRKSQEDGYFITDSENQLFHLKMIKGEPYVRKIEIPKGLVFKHIKCIDHKDRRHYAYLLGEDGGFYMLEQNDYNLVRLPIDGYIAEEQAIRVNSDYFNYEVMIQSEYGIRCFALDKNYNIVDKYEHSWIPNKEKTVGKIASAIFPFTLSLEDDNSLFFKLYTRVPSGIIWLIINLIFVAIQIVSLKKREQELKKNLFDIIIISVSGIYGFIAVNIFPNKF